MKRFSLVVLLFISIFTLAACNDPEPVIEEITYTVTFDSDEGSTVEALEIIEGELAVEPAVPTKEGYSFSYWYETDDTTQFDFSSPITVDVTLNALWQVVVVEMTDEDRINLDIEEYEKDMYDSASLLNTPIRGALYRSSIKWEADSMYISNDGVLLPLPSDVAEHNGQITATFKLNDATVVKTFDIPLYHVSEVVIDNVRSVDFENLTTEYVVEDSTINLYYQEDGTVPYVKVVDFFDLLEGFIDPTVDITFTNTAGVLEIYYQYYDEDEDITYDLILTIDSIENTIGTNDPGFFWAYIQSTETNYGRHIDYDYDNPDGHFDEGEDIIYDLDDYNMDIVVYEDKVVIPLYVANQLLATPGYFNVYYNTDGLYGIYAIPEDRELRVVGRSSMNNEDLPVDLLIHSFNMLAFDLNYLYGLKDLMEIDNYYDILYEQKDDLLVLDPEDFDYAIRDLLLLSLDEPHTSYLLHSYFNKITFGGPETNSLSFYGTRFVQWYYDGYAAVDDVIEAKWGRGDISSNAWAATSPNRPDYWFLDDVSVMLSLDGFSTADINETVSFDLAIIEKILDVTDGSIILPEITEGNKFFYYNNSTEKEDILEIIVKGVSSDYGTDYHDALIALGYEFINEATDDEDKENGYYKITVDVTDPIVTTIDFMVQITYDEEFGLFYVGVIDSAPDTFEDAWPLYIDIDDIVNSDSAVYMEMMIDQILAISPGLENIMLDLSWNTGGNVGALYRVVGFITDDPFRVSSIDGDTGGYSSSYVDITGIDAYDTLNWSLLITPVSFSAANEMVVIFLENELGPIIGVKSGGGACSITPVLLPNGTAFIMSSNNINAYRTGAGTTEDPYVYHNTEFGIDPDYPIDIEDIYDETILLDIILND